ncbi:MAG: PGF-CTERM protein [Natronomonas sp.]|jgi:PGF-CTERM protein|uniref:hypothetical protein n=1 Tax=Natronomonas sp. TaxID=2184060 RepID=UPI00398962CD
MPTNRRLVVVLAAVLSLSLFVGSVAFVPGVATASHDPEDGDFTVEPIDDRTPGATNVKYGQVVVAQAGVDLKTLEESVAIYKEGSWSSCESSDSEVFGIDRGNTHDGYEVDEDLEDNTKSFSAGEDRFEVQFYDDDDFGTSVGFNNSDAFISVAKCVDNPDEPGWYQISGSTTGVTESGERVTFGSDSHYFWICDCEDEQEAREKLGPPPSEPEQTATPTATPEQSDTEDESTTTTETTQTESTAQADEDEAQTAPEQTATAEPTDTETATATPEPTSTPTDASWERHVVQTPTPGDGDGFGGGVALLAIIGTALIARRRR